MNQLTVMPFSGAIPTRKGRERTYPLHTMETGQFFFLPGREGGNLASYVSHQAKKLERKFATRSLVMKQVDGLWVEARAGEEGATPGIAIYRTD